MSAKCGKLLGVFPVKTTGVLVNVQVPDGTYKDLITGRDVEVRFGMLSVSDEAVIIRA